MKKFYVAPEMEIEKIELEQALCSISDPVPNGGSSPITPGEGFFD